jgi:hypothetical protein
LAVASQNELLSFQSTVFNQQTQQFELVTRYERVIRFAEWNDADAAANEVRRGLTIKEMANNWDSREELVAVVPAAQHFWTEFLQKSQWTNINPNNPDYFTRSHDNKWWYLNTSRFANDFAKTNPEEDYASIWDIMFDDDQFTQRQFLSEKILVVDRIFTALAGFPG